jgi:hypothetical protein
MTSKIKVDNINKVSDDSNIIKKCGTTITLGASGDSIALASGASQTGFGRTGTVDWNTTPKTTGTFSAVSGDGFFLNTSGGVITANLPAGSAGAIVSFADYAGTWQTNNVTVTPNGTDKIGSVNASVTLNTEGQSVTFIFVDSTQGWINTMDSTSNVRANSFIVATGGTITTSGNDKIHTFTGPGDFTVTQAATNPANNVVDYLVVASGGGGGENSGGGGGAGGHRTSFPGGTQIPVVAQAYTIAVGGGGATSSPGNVSTFSTITSAGGGRGANLANGQGGPPHPAPVRGGDGGSGGGAGGAHGGTSGIVVGGQGNTPPTPSTQGNNGGNGQPGSCSGVGCLAGGGGGGANAVGANAVAGGGSHSGGTGGGGKANSITGSSVTRAGGGGAGQRGPGPNIAGGSGGGGQGASENGTSIVGTANLGGGGGGGSNVSPKAGGSGVVIIRYRFQ